MNYELRSGTYTLTDFDVLSGCKGTEIREICLNTDPMPSNYALDILYFPNYHIKTLSY